MAYLAQDAKSKDRFLWCFLKTRASILMATVLVTSSHCRMCSLLDSAARHLVWQPSVQSSKQAVEQEITGLGEEMNHAYVDA